MRELKVDLENICSDQAQRKMAASLASLGSELFALRHWCEESQAWLLEEQRGDKAPSAGAMPRSVSTSSFIIQFNGTKKDGQRRKVKVTTVL